MDTKVLDKSDVIISSPKNEFDALLKVSVNTEIIKSIDIVLQNLIEGNILNNENLMFIITNMMSAIGKYKTLTGPEKKKIIIILVNVAIDNSEHLDLNTKNIMKMTMTTVVPSAIDVMVDISKGRYKFKYIPKLVECWKTLKCCCK
jgi:hypothetical protein